MSQLETQLYNVMRLQLNILNDENIQELQRLDIEIKPAECIYKLNSIRDKLVETMSMNMYIKEITVYLPLMGRKVTTQSVLPLETEEYHIFFKKASIEQLPFSYIDQDYYINMTPDFSDQSSQMAGEPKMHVVSICVWKEVIQSEMEDMIGEEGRAILIGDGRGLDLQSELDESFRKVMDETMNPLPLKNNMSDHMKIEGEQYHIFLYPSTFLHSVLAIYIPNKTFMKPLWIFSSWIWLLSILTLILVALFSIWMKGIIVRPLEKLIEALKHAEDDTNNVRVNYNKDDEFGDIYRQFNYLVDRLKLLIADVYKKELALKDAEFKQLQYQINPHFLYNSLLVTNGLITLDETDGALKLTRHLSSYYQYITKGQAGEIELYKEVQHAMDYCEVQGIRFQGRIQSQFDEIPKHVRNFCVPRLILQPIVENGYKHGLKNKRQNGRLRVSVTESGSYIQINVEDNGEELTDRILASLGSQINEDDNGTMGTGLINVHNRLRIKFKEDSGLRMDRSNMGGLRVMLLIYRKDNCIV